MNGYEKVQPPACPVPDGVKDLEAFMRGHVRVIKTVDNTPKWGWLKHISVSCADRYPTWHEILHAKEHFFGDTDCMMVMPKKEDYINLHPNVFHVWKTPESWNLQ